MAFRAWRIFASAGSRVRSEHFSSLCFRMGRSFAGTAQSHHPDHLLQSSRAAAGTISGRVATIIVVARIGIEFFFELRVLQVRSRICTHGMKIELASEKLLVRVGQCRIVAIEQVV